MECVCSFPNLPTHKDLMGLIDGYIPDLINFSNIVSGFVGGGVTLGLPAPGIFLLCLVLFVFGCYLWVDPNLEVC